MPPEAIEALPRQVAELIDDPKKLLEIPGIGKGMAANLREILQEGELGLHAQLIEKYRPSMLELLKIQGLGPKTVNLIWTEFSGLRRCRRGAAGARGQAARPAAHEREDRAENPEGDRDLSQHLRPLLSR